MKQKYNVSLFRGLPTCDSHARRARNLENVLQMYSSSGLTINYQGPAQIGVLNTQTSKPVVLFGRLETMSVGVRPAPLTRADARCEFSANALLHVTLEQ